MNWNTYYIDKTTDTRYATMVRHLFLVRDLLLLSALFCAASSGPVCYKCDNLPHQRDCDVIIECGDHEVCYGERLVRSDGITYFKSGCKSKSFCLDAGSNLILGKRDITSCTKCCNTSYCNREICDIHKETTGVRCLSCKYATTPDSCFVSVRCSPGEVCYSQTIIHNQEKRYRLGCAPQQYCGVPSTSGDTPAQNDYCGQCCNDGENCNREVCSGGQASNLQLVQPLPLDPCRDNSTYECQKNMDRCTEDYYKLYQCPYTCGFCTGHLEVVNDCLSNPCMNDGTCTDGVNSYTCTCVDGYTGQNCETDVDDCLSLPCKNGATCTDGINSYSCTCTGGYTGKDCDKDIDECSSNPCQNNGTCHNLHNSYKCTCRHGFTGQNCGTDIDECSSSPCIHGGTCTDKINSYSCECMGGYSGTNCEKACSGPRYFQWNHHCYYITDTPDIWMHHKAIYADPCEKRGMHLADIHGDPEYQAIINNVRTKLHETAIFWMGGRFNVDEQVWYWKDGRVIPNTSHHWVKHADRHADTVCMVMSGGLWSYRNCFEHHLHLCESELPQ